MATINRENISLLNDRITVKVDQEDYSPGFQKVLKQYSKQANIPGFRKGMVPAGLIKKMHGQEIFTQEVVKSVEQGLNDYLKKEELEIFGNPLPVETDTAPNLDVNNPGEYTFDFEVGIKPDFEITPLKEDFHFTHYKIKPDEKKIDEEVERLQKARGEHKEKEEVSSDEDVLYLRFRPSDAEGNLTEGGEEKQEQLRLSFFAPDTQKQLMGKKKEDVLNVSLKEAFEEKELDWILRDWKLEKEGEHYFQLTINKIEEIISRELTEEFFKEIYPQKEIKTAEDFKAEIANEMQGYWDQEATNRLDQEIFEKLVHDTPIELPEEFLKKWMKQEGEKPKTDEEVAEGYSNFDHQLRWNLISAKLLKDFDISATPEEVGERVRQRVVNYFSQGMPAGLNQPFVNDIVNKMMQDEKTVRETYQEVLTDKLFKQLRDKAKLEEKEITEKEFLQLPHNHHHHEHE